MCVSVFVYTILRGKKSPVRSEEEEEEEEEEGAFLAALLVRWWRFGLRPLPTFQVSGVFSSISSFLVK